MKIKETKIKIKDIMDGYRNSDENGVRAYGGRLMYVHRSKENLFTMTRSVIK